MGSGEPRNRPDYAWFVSSLNLAGNPVLDMDFDASEVDRQSPGQQNGSQVI